MPSRCGQGGCVAFARYGKRGAKKAERCRKHAKGGMVIVVTKKSDMFALGAKPGMMDKRKCIEMGCTVMQPVFGKKQEVCKAMVDPNFSCEPPGGTGVKRDKAAKAGRSQVGKDEPKRARVDPQTARREEISAERRGDDAGPNEPARVADESPGFSSAEKGGSNETSGAAAPAVDARREPEPREEKDSGGLGGEHDGDPAEVDVSQGGKEGPRHGGVDPQAAQGENTSSVREEARPNERGRAVVEFPGAASVEKEGGSVAAVDAMPAEDAPRDREPLGEKDGGTRREHDRGAAEVDVRQGGKEDPEHGDVDPQTAQGETSSGRRDEGRPNARDLEVGEVPGDASLDKKGGNVAPVDAVPAANTPREPESVNAIQTKSST